MELSPAVQAPSLRRLRLSLDGWALVTVVIALAVAAPLLALPLSFVVAGDARPSLEREPQAPQRRRRRPEGRAQFHPTLSLIHI